MTDNSVPESTLADSTNEINDMNTARHRVYQLLSRLFAKELDWQMVKELNGNAAQAFWLQLATQSEFRPHVDAVVSVLAGLKTKANLLELAADYCGLFLVDTHNSVSPYASFYMGDRDTTLFGEQHQKITAFLQQHKLQIQSEFSEPADHIAVILAYAGHLALYGNPKNQIDFLQAYLASWLDRFVLQIEKTDPGRFYSALAQLTLAWLGSELEWLHSSQ